MKQDHLGEFSLQTMDSSLFEKIDTLTEEVYMGKRVCDNCGDYKDVSGGKTCSKGHFLCHSCASRHVHCTVCGHTLR